MKNTIIILTLLLQSVIVFGSPNWVVDVSGYEYSLTLTAVVELDNSIAVAENDIIGVFVDGECRGVASAVFVEQYDKCFFYLTVFSNTYSGEEVALKYYNTSGDSIYSGFESLIFADADNYGTISDPFVIKTTTTNIYNSSFGKKINIYPNPVRDVLNIISHSSIDKVTVYNSIGTPVFESSQNIQSLDMSGFCSGLYIIEFVGNGIYCTKQVVKL